MRARRTNLMMLALILSITGGLVQATTDEQKPADELRHCLSHKYLSLPCLF